MSGSLPPPDPNDGLPVGPLQLRIMHAVWRQGARTVADVRAALDAEPGAKELAYTTILTVMRNLVRRGFLVQDRSERTHRFAARIGEAELKQAVVRRVLRDYCDGDLQRMISYAGEAGPGRSTQAG